MSHDTTASPIINEWITRPQGQRSLRTKQVSGSAAAQFQDSVIVDGRTRLMQWFEGLTAYSAKLDDYDARIAEARQTRPTGSAADDAANALARVPFPVFGQK